MFYQVIGRVVFGRSSGRRGASLIELSIGILVIGLISFVLFQSIGFMIGTQALATSRVQALNVADGRLGSMMAAPYSAIAQNSRSNWDELQIGTTTFHVQDQTQRAQVDGVDYVLIDVRVRWPDTSADAYELVLRGERWP